MASSCECRVSRASVSAGGSVVVRWDLYVVAASVGGVGVSFVWRWGMMSEALKMIGGRVCGERWLTIERVNEGMIRLPWLLGLRRTFSDFAGALLACAWR